MEMTQMRGTLGTTAADMAAVAADRVAADRVVSDRAVRLADLATGAVARVVSVAAVDANGSSELGRRLAELGFLPGERLRIVARGLLGREPLAVRIGTSTFALRLFEAACIRVCPEQPLQA